MEAGQGTFRYVPPGEGPTWSLMGEVVIFKATGEDTGGGYSFFETLSQPQNGAPLHIHPHMDEALYVVDGEFLLQAGDEKFTATAGAFAYSPKGLPHAYKNVGAQSGKLLFIVTPGGYEKFFEAMSELSMNSPEDMSRAVEVARRFGVEIVGPLP